MRCNRNSLAAAVALAIGLALSAGAASAQNYAVARHGSREHVRFGFADVLRVDPVYRQVRESRPREECFDEEVTRVERRDGTGGTIVGALVGGALGNTIGGGDGRRAATVAGAVIGGAVGGNVDRNNDGPAREYRDLETRCRLVEEVATRRELVGYDVEYRYRGDVYQSRIDYDPGSRLRVRVAVAPTR